MREFCVPTKMRCAPAPTLLPLCPRPLSAPRTHIGGSPLSKTQSLPEKGGVALLPSPYTTPSKHPGVVYGEVPLAMGNGVKYEFKRHTIPINSIIIMHIFDYGFDRPDACLRSSPQAVKYALLMLVAFFNPISLPFPSSQTPTAI